MRDTLARLQARTAGQQPRMQPFKHNRPMNTAASPRILVTGFEPFGGQRLNPSLEVARALDGEVIEGASVVGLELPCVFDQALVQLRAALARHTPAVVLALGQAEGRCDVSFERVAINVNDARIADNAGAQPVDTPVMTGQANALFSTLPIKRLVAGLRAAGIPASVSSSAGTFVCNHVFYGLQQALDGQGVRSGFVHLPLLPVQAASWNGPSMPSMALDLQVQGIRLAAALTLRHADDLALAEGTLN